MQTTTAARCANTKPRRPKRQEPTLFPDERGEQWFPLDRLLARIDRQLGPRDVNEPGPISILSDRVGITACAIHKIINTGGKIHVSTADRWAIDCGWMAHEIWDEYAENCPT